MSDSEVYERRRCILTGDGFSTFRVCDGCTHETPCRGLHFARCAVWLCEACWPVVVGVVAPQLFRPLHTLLAKPVMPPNVFQNAGSEHPTKKTR